MRVLEKIPGKLEVSFLIFLTLGLIKQSNALSNLAESRYPPSGAIFEAKSILPRFKRE